MHLEKIFDTILFVIYTDKMRVMLTSLTRNTSKKLQIRLPIISLHKQCLCCAKKTKEILYSVILLTYEQ